MRQDCHPGVLEVVSNSLETRIPSLVCQLTRLTAVTELPNGVVMPTVDMR